MSDLSQISRNIKYYRERMGLTQRVLADNVLVSFQAISAWERGQSVPDLENALRLSEFFGISLDVLVAEPEQAYLVGVDGNSQTEFVLFQCDGTVERIYHGDCANPTDVGIENTLKVLETGLEIVLRGKPPKAIFAGVAGASGADYRSELETALRKRFGGNVQVNTNAANVLSMGADPENAMAVICRSGSCVYVRKADAFYRVGGWGKLLDHSGSAYNVGMDAVRHALAAEDGLEEKSLLSALITEHLGGSVFAKISAINQNSRTYISSFAELVTRVALQGDSAALEILKKNAETLAKLIRTAIERYGAPSQIVAAGELLKLDVFRTMVEESAGVMLELPEVSTVYGACVEAMRAAKHTLDADFYRNFVASYSRKNAK